MGLRSTSSMDQWRTVISPFQEMMAHRQHPTSPAVIPSDLGSYPDTKCFLNSAKFRMFSQPVLLQGCDTCLTTASKSSEMFWISLYSWMKSKFIHHLPHIMCWATKKLSIICKIKAESQCFEMIWKLLCFLNPWLESNV